MLGRVLLRTILVAIVFVYVLPCIGGIEVHADAWRALAASLLFNAFFWGMECLLAAVVFGINVGTLGVGAFAASAVRLFATAVSPALSLVGTAHLLPGSLHIGSYFPGALCAGLALAGAVRIVSAGKEKQAC